MIEPKYIEPPIVMNDRPLTRVFDKLLADALDKDVEEVTKLFS